MNNFVLGVQKVHASVATILIGPHEVKILAWTCTLNVVISETSYISFHLKAPDSLGSLAL